MTKYGTRSMAELDDVTAVRKNRQGAPLSVELLSGADIQPKAVKWLWKDWLALGKIALLAGAPGTGKSTLAVAIAAIITRGGTMPDGEPVEAADVLVWSGEDDVADTLLPRFLIAGGDRARIHFVGPTSGGDDEQRPFDPAKDMPALIEVARRLDRLVLVILDPIVSAVAGDSHKNTEARRGLQPIVDLAAATGAAVLGVTHFAKSSAGRDPQERVNGSIAFTAVARIVLATVKPADPNAPRRLVRAKSNLGPDHGGIEYTLSQAPVPGEDLVAQCVDWGQVLVGSAHELMKVEATDNKATATAEAEAFLRDMLAEGPKATKELEAAAEAHGHAWRTVERAKKVLGVSVEKTGFQGGWVWRMPTPKAADFHREDPLRA